MTWCKNNFQLEIYNESTGNRIVRCPLTSRIYYGRGFLELIDFRGNKGDQIHFFGKEFKSPAEIIPFCIKQGWINEEWQRCADWFWENKNLIYGQPNTLGQNAGFLWRGIHPDLYEKLLLLGSTTADLIDEYEYSFGIPDKRFTDSNLHKSDYVWASNFIEKAWEVSVINKYNPAIIVAYRPEFFRQFEKHEYTWIKKDKTMDYKDTVEAIFRVYYVY